MNKKDLLRESKKKKSNNGYLSGYSNPSTYEAQKAIGIYGNPAGGIGRFNSAEDSAGEMNGSASGDGASSSGSNAGGALMEDTFFATRYERTIETPPQIKILNKTDIENALDELSPMEEFEVGYLTPVYLYKEFIDKFVLLKATTMTGFTKVDFIDAKAHDSANDQKRIQISKDKIALGTDNGSHENGRPMANRIADFSADYKSTNTTVKQNHFDKDTGEKEFETLLFYPKIGSTPKVYYFLDTLKGKGYRKVTRDVIEQTVIKLLNEYIEKIKLGIVKKPRWQAQDLIKKLNASFEQDEATIESKTFNNTDNYETRSTLSTGIQEKKFPVRALYTNQIFYIKTPYQTLGSQLLESSELDENKFSGGHSKEKFKPSAGVRYVRRYYIKPQNVFCSNKSDVLNALIEFEDQDMTIYTMNNLPDDSKDTSKLTKDDVIYYYEDGILFDKNGVKILPLIKIRDEENRDEVDVKSASDATLRKVYDDRLTGLSEDINEAFSLDFDNINAYGEKLVEGKVVGGTCCICGEEIVGEPNNAEPYKKGNCCDACYHKFVEEAEEEV